MHDFFSLLILVSQYVFNLKNLSKGWLIKRESELLSIAAEFMRDLKAGDLSVITWNWLKRKEQFFLECTYFEMREQQIYLSTYIYIYITQ